MSNFKLIALDLDDTLLNDRLEISPGNRRALAKAAQLGCLVTVATGRMFRSARPFALELGIKIPIITYQGALVKDVLTGEVIVDMPVPLELAREVLVQGYDAGIHMNVYVDDNLYVDEITPEGEFYASLARTDMIAVGDLLDFLDRAPSKILYVAEPHILDRLKTVLDGIFGDKLYITKSKPNFLEFMHPRATKGLALEALARQLGILREEVIAFGDSYNDLDMLKYAGLGVAMGNAPAEVRAAAGLVTDTNNNDGVARVIEKYIIAGGM